MTTETEGAAGRAIDPTRPDGEPDVAAGAPYTLGWRSQYSVWRDNDWRQFLVGLVREAYGRTPTYAAHNDAVVALLDRIPVVLREEVETTFEEDAAAALGYCVLLAYGLGCTAGGVEALDRSWLERAKALAGLGDEQPAGAAS